MLVTKNDQEIDTETPIRFIQSFSWYYPMCDIGTCTEEALNYFDLGNGKAVALCPDCEYLFSSIDWNNPSGKGGIWPDIYERKTGEGPKQSLFKRVLTRLDKEKIR